jgi:hypothetical protein
MKKLRLLVSARLLAASALLAVVAFAAWPASGGGAQVPRIPKIPNVPKVPKVPKFTSYPVTIDVAGYVDFNWTWDDRAPCIPGYSKTVSEEASFELGKPRRSTINAVGGAVTMPFAIGGEAKVKAVADGYHTTNWCPPTAPDPEPPAPECKTLTGKLGAALVPETDKGGDDDLAPLGRGVMLALVRRKGGFQEQSCLQNRPSLRAIKKDEGVLIDTTPLPGGTIVVPLVNATRFWSLKPGQRLERTIAIGGGCDRVKATSSALNSHITRCTISGKIVVVKRLK